MKNKEAILIEGYKRIACDDKGGYIGFKYIDENLIISAIEKMFLIFDDNIFNRIDSNIIYNIEEPELHLRILEEGKMVENGFRYFCEIITNNKDLKVLGKYFTKGSKWKIDYTIKEELL